MKILLFLYALIFITSCNGSSAVKTTSATKEAVKEKPDCTENYDSLLLRYANNFTPTAINLSKTISTDLDTFLLHVDTECLRKQNKYQFFICSILAKLFYYHVVKGHQGYDLQSMEQGGAKIIIDEFKKMAGYDKQRFDMLNSAVVVDFIGQNKSLKTDTSLQRILRQIKVEADLIDKRNSKEIHQ